MKKIIPLLLSLLFMNCGSDDSGTVTPEEQMYFPPNDATTWETKTTTSLNWNAANIPELLDYLEIKNSKSFIVLHNGKIVMEHYFNGHTATTPWYWASAGKTLTTAVVGIAEQENFINTNNKVSDYIGTAWTNAPLAKENLITCKHLLTMSSGLNDANQGIEPVDLEYLADAGTRWAYHTVFFKLQNIVAESTNSTWDNYFNTKLKNPIGMTGTWLPGGGSENVYWSTTRSMARFGLLVLNQGKWKSNQIVNSAYFNLSTNTSQNLNLAYGYMWWLNGKSSYRLPQSQIQFNGKLIESAPNEMYCALGKDDQKIYIIPSKKIVIIRMGDAADISSFGLSDFDQTLWEKINAVIN